MSIVLLASRFRLVRTNFRSAETTPRRFSTWFGVTIVAMAVTCTIDFRMFSFSRPISAANLMPLKMNKLITRKFKHCLNDKPWWTSLQPEKFSCGQIGCCKPMWIRGPRTFLDAINLRYLQNNMRIISLFTQADIFLLFVCSFSSHDFSEWVAFNDALVFSWWIEMNKKSTMDFLYNHNHRKAKRFSKLWPIE